MIKIRRFLLIGLVILVSTTITAWATLAFADNHCDKNDGKNCNHSDKNQNSSPKIDCEIHINAEDHLNNNDFGPTQQQCLNNSNNIKDSTVTQTSPGNNNGDFTSLTVLSTDPKDNDNNVPSDLSEITVTFSEKIDKNSVDTGSLSVFADNCVICNDPDIDSVSVSGKTATFSINSNDPLSPDTNYIASISSSIEDQNGNFLDCFGSKGVDDNCEWNFSTSGSTLNPTISINPSSGPVFTLVTITGNGFAPNIPVAITFDGVLVGTNPATVTTNSNGEFSSVTITIPSSSSGVHTIAANLASEPFTVTPAISLSPTSGPVGTPVNITGIGFSTISPVTIKFNTTDGVSTTPSTVIPNANGGFLANFTIPPSSPPSSIGPVPVTATQGSNSASKTFTVTQFSGLVATSQSNVVTPSSPNLSEKMILPDIFA